MTPSKTTEAGMRGMDAMCLVECVYWGEREKTLYDECWEHGIYEFRQRCWELAEYTHSAWNYVSDRTDFCCFDSMFCPELIAWWLKSDHCPDDTGPDAVGKFVDSYLPRLKDRQEKEWQLREAERRVSILEELERG